MNIQPPWLHTLKSYPAPRRRNLTLSPPLSESWCGVVCAALTHTHTHLYTQHICNNHNNIMHALPLRRRRRRRRQHSPQGMQHGTFTRRAAAAAAVVAFTQQRNQLDTTKASSHSPLPAAAAHKSRLAPIARNQIVELIRRSLSHFCSPIRIIMLYVCAHVRERAHHVPGVKESLGAHGFCCSSQLSAAMRTPSLSVFAHHIQYITRCAMHFACAYCYSIFV